MSARNKVRYQHWQKTWEMSGALETVASSTALLKPTENQKLFQRFEKDVIYDAHSIRARVSRSEAGRQILSQGKQVLGELAVHLTGYKPPTEIRGLRKDVRWAWGILMSWLAKDHSLPGRPESQHNFPAWVEWVRTQALQT